MNKKPSKNISINPKKKFDHQLLFNERKEQCRTVEIEKKDSMWKKCYDTKNLINLVIWTICGCDSMNVFVHSIALRQKNVY